MDKDFEGLIIQRCEEAKLEDDEYLKCERGDHEAEEVQSLAEILCYKKGLQDAKYFYGLLKM